MANFSSDVDILKYEPGLFGELHIPGQVLTAGSAGALSGTSFAAVAADFESAQVGPGCVIYLQSADGAVDGAYEVVSVDSATELTVSVLRADSDESAVAPPAGTDVSYRVTTYRPQAEEVGFRLTEYLGIRPGNSSSEIEPADIVDADVLSRASVFAVISAVYAMLASGPGGESMWQKSIYYRGLFDKSLQRLRVGIDLDSDGVADVTRQGGVGRLERV